MRHEFVPIPGARGYQHSNPDVMAMTCLLASLQIFSQTSVQKIRQKSYQLTSYFRHLLAPIEGPSGAIQFITSADAEACGAQVTLKINYVPINEFMRRFRSAGIVCDARRSQVIRITFTGLYNTFEDVFVAASAIVKATE